MGRPGRLYAQTSAKRGNSMKKEKDNVLPKMVRKVVKAARGSEHDPLGSYTGTPADDPDERPTQDADDL